MVKYVDRQIYYFCSIDDSIQIVRFACLGMVEKELSDEVKEEIRIAREQEGTPLDEFIDMLEKRRKEGNFVEFDSI